MGITIPRPPPMGGEVINVSMLPGHQSNLSDFARSSSVMGHEPSQLGVSLPQASVVQGTQSELRGGELVNNMYSQSSSTIVGANLSVAPRIENIPLPLTSSLLGSQSLLKYGSLVRGIARSGGDFAGFDERFRYLRQQTLCSWDSVNAENYITSMLNCNRLTPVRSAPESTTQSYTLRNKGSFDDFKEPLGFFG